MIGWVYLPLLLSLPVPAVVGTAAFRVAPAVAAWVAVATAAVAATASTICLALLALTLCDDLPPLRVLDDRPELGLPKPVPGWVALAAALVLCAGLLRLTALLRSRRRMLRELRAVGEPAYGMVVADWGRPYAIAVPGRPGHVLVTSGMLRLLDDGERRVLFAHEQSHLSRRHHRLVVIVAWSAAMNPLLIPLRTMVALLVERWADEDAADAVGDRRLVAATVVKASLATVGGPGSVLGLHGASTTRRVSALVSPVSPSRGSRLVGVLVFAALLLTVTTVATVEFVEIARVWLTHPAR